LLIFQGRRFSGTGLLPLRFVDEEAVYCAAPMPGASGMGANGNLMLKRQCS